MDFIVLYMLPFEIYVPSDGLGNRKCGYGNFWKSSAYCLVE